jgi:hypothetical protein
MMQRRRDLQLIILALLAAGLAAWSTWGPTGAAPMFQSSIEPTPTWTWTPSITPTPGTPTPATPTPTRQPIRTEIVFPQAGDVVYGSFPIIGTAVVNDYQSFQLHISLAGQDEWFWLNGGFHVVRDGELGQLMSARFEDGFYDLRVRSIRNNGNYREGFVRGFEIRNLNPPTPTPIPSEVDPDAATPILPPLSPLATPTPPPTPTPDHSSFVPGGQGIYSPRSGERLGSYVPIVGTANGKHGQPFLRYEIYRSVSGQETWEWLFSSQDQWYNSPLYVLDTVNLAPGFYDLRLRIVYRDSNYDEYTVRNLRLSQSGTESQIHASQIHIRAPRHGARITGIVDVAGTVAGSDFQRWELYWSPHPGQEASWQFLYQGSYQVVNDLIARLDLSQVPPGLYDLRLRLVRRDGNYEDRIIQRLHVVQPTQ